MMNVCLKNGLVEPIINLCFRTDLSHQELIGEITDDDEKVQGKEKKEMISSPCMVLMWSLRTVSAIIMKVQ